MLVTKKKFKIEHSILLDFKLSNDRLQNTRKLLYCSCTAKDSTKWHWQEFKKCETLQNDHTDFRNGFNYKTAIRVRW